MWEFTSVAEVRRLFPLINRYLGRRRAFWKWLIESWVELGLAGGP